MGRTEGSGAPPESSVPPSSPPSAGEGSALSPSGSSQEPSAWRAGLRDDEVDEIERRIADDDLLEEADRRPIEEARRRLADQAWLDEAVVAGFTGPAFDLQWEEFARYGIAVMMKFTRTGMIFDLCAKHSWPIDPALRPSQWSREDRLEVVVETVARALDAFLHKVLIPGIWDPTKGASLKTFFIGQALKQFPNVFNLWAKEHIVWHNRHHITDEVPEDEDMPRQCPADPTCEAALEEPSKQALLEQIEDPNTRGAVEIMADGHTQAEAGEPFGLSARAVEGRIRRLRDGSGWVECPKR